MSTRVKTNPVVMGVQTKNVTLIKSTTYTGEDYHYANGTTLLNSVKK